MRQRNNAEQFIAVVKKAYAASKKVGTIPAADISIYDKLVACPAVVYPVGGGHSRPIHLHRQWERRVARMYRRKSGRPLRGFFDDIDWEEIWAWIMENIVPIIKMILMLAPFLI